VAVFQCGGVAPMEWREEGEAWSNRGGERGTMVQQPGLDRRSVEREGATAREEPMENRAGESFPHGSGRLLL
jgi:hypothetical protein